MMPVESVMGLWDVGTDPLLFYKLWFLSVVPAPDRFVSVRDIDSDFPVSVSNFAPLFRSSCRLRSVLFSAFPMTDTRLAAYPHSILLALSLIHI